MMQRGFKEKGGENGKGSWRARNKPRIYNKVHKGIDTNQSHFRKLEIPRLQWKAKGGEKTAAKVSRK